MKFAVFTVSTPTYTPEDAVAKLKEIGYDGIEWRVIDEEPYGGPPGFWKGNLCNLSLSSIVEEAPRFRRLASDAGLGTPTIAPYVKCNDIEGAALAMRGATALGVSQLRIQVPSYSAEEPFQPKWDRAREHYKSIAELAATLGVRALIELHHRTICPSASSARLFLDGFDPAHVGVIHDAGNMVYEGFENYRLGLEILGPYLAHIHLKNARWFPIRTLPDRTVEWSVDAAAVHKGMVDVRALFRALHAIGYDGWVTIEDFSIERPLDERLAENLAYVKAVEAETRLVGGATAAPSSASRAM
ncbi:MAG: sugar phosphate isomerase/epimerase [Chloroflexia bacterium]|nr:sugar phosphate isomerase/epimerase [Chloroflexia bacterium]